MQNFLLVRLSIVGSTLVKISQVIKHVLLVYFIALDVELVHREFYWDWLTQAMLLGT